MKLCGVCIITDDVPRLVAFYKEILQIEPEGNDIHSAFNEAQLAIYNPGNVPQSNNRYLSLMYYVNDAEKEYERLRNLGSDIVLTSELKVEPWGVKAFVFKDPDGNEVNFLQPLDIQ
jgi:predicted enzyme related to lactoylglutathione lyase